MTLGFGLDSRVGVETFKIIHGNITLLHLAVWESEGWLIAAYSDIITVPTQETRHQ